MAKKSLTSLMNGIMGDDEPEVVETVETVKVSEPEKPAETPKEEAPAAEMKKEEATPRRGAGRPKKVVAADQPEDIRATFVMNPEQQRHIKYISLMEGKMLKTILAEALASYIDNWQSENGRIPSLKKKK